MRIAPETVCLAITTPVIRDPGSADEADAPVDAKKFPVRPVIHLRELIEAKDFHLRTGTAEQFHLFSMKAIAPKSVLQEMDLHSSASAVCQGAGKLLPDPALL